MSVLQNVTEFEGSAMLQEQQLNLTSPSDSAAGFPPLKTIWEDLYCQKCNVGNKNGRERLRCGQQFKPVHHTWACAHYAKIPKEGIAACTAAILELEFKRYIVLWSCSGKRKTELMMVKMIITEDKGERLSTAMKRLLEESNKKPKISPKLKQYFKSAGMKEHQSLRIAYH
jgi:late competence protein required for DNA uptake (superfamily II DNA/RNA helicase)